ncbi:transmembrane protein, putative [Medicago truncatula]|uniref:Transmembrane protein, putative n=1 Tax=Medicago truncatula TaxID=3880 RepID=G7ZZV6_MEDTR|nr:transmembrane protein, putative [Medicago truncatula]
MLMTVNHSTLAKNLSDVNVADPKAMNIPMTLILSYIFVDIMPLHAINLDAVSLFADSSFTFLAVLNDVISRFE